VIVAHESGSPGAGAITRNMSKYVARRPLKSPNLYSLIFLVMGFWRIMTEEQPDLRARYIQEIKDLVFRHHDRALDYDKQALDTAKQGFAALSYLNGGGLIAIPAAVALFKLNPTEAKVPLVTAAALFVFGLLLGIAAQWSAFFTLAKRSEAESALADHEAKALMGAHSSGQVDVESASIARRKHGQSDCWRLTGIACYLLSMIVFIAGCWFGAQAVLGSH
jgi:hypothetical protein